MTRGRGAFVVAALLAAACVARASLSASLSVRQRAAAAYRRAVQLRVALESRSQPPMVAYKRAIDAFRLVYRIDPAYPKTPASLAAAAEIYQEMGRRFADDRYYAQAIKAFQFLASQYPGESVSSDALFTVAEIYRTDIENPSQARAAYQQFLKEYPYGSKAVAARREIARIDLKLERGQNTSRMRPRATSRVAPPATQSGVPTSTASEGNASRMPELEGIHDWVGPNYTRVVIQLNGEAKFNAMHLSNPPRLVFDLSDTRLASDLARKVFPVESGFLRRIRVAQFQPTVTRVVLDVPEIEDYSVFSLPHPFRLVIDVHGSAPVATARNARTPASAPAFHGRGAGSVEVSPPASATTSGTPSLTRALGLKIRRIVIDPGHGGHDTGTIGPGGLEEKNVVLGVALRLRTLLRERMGCQVFMTRSTDKFIPLEERTAIANQDRADLFISIHANSSSDPHVRGIETYYLNFTSDPAALRLAARENATSRDNVYQLQSLIKKIALTEKIDESRQFASTVDHQLAIHLSDDGYAQPDRGVKTAPFVVLIGANMPSILVEISFLSNPRDDELLRLGSYREQIAQALCDGIVRYAHTLGTIRIAAQPHDEADPPRF